ncbi:SusC/RagA family TonB-linked outer membrane protein [Chitinophaga sp. 22321]|uniref:TonB-dependent receptor n=1 Tax=Chitinophaga hostae TaxID=2831022 RepID=A0ABS5J133_9BACT|nr:TonB-dependent receptor [Chitinophaga hostae]MBS0028939.1 TonB-dependent receptor [Chitinophaga hostae]
MNVNKCCKLLLYLTVILCLGPCLGAFSQQISVPAGKKSIREVLEYIEKTTSYRFLYTEDPMFDQTAGTYDGKSTDITTVLTALLKGTDIAFRLNNNKLVTLHTPRSALLAGRDTAGTNITISGNIGNLQQQPLTSVSIYLKANPLVGTVSDKNGYFILSNIPRYSTLVFSSVGYKTQEVDIKTIPNASLRKFPVLMESESLTKDEVVVTAMGVQKKVSVVGAITTVNPTELRAPTRSLTTQLAGRVAGVTFVQQSGQPGQDGASFIIRGINSVTGNTAPLVLIDGLRRNIDDVDPNDIATFSILKDASATAVYGLEGSNGIIVITTKTGKIASRPTIRVSASTSLNNASYKPQWVDAPTYARMKNEALVVRGKRPFYTNEEIAKFADTDMDFYPNVDWYKTMVKQNNPSNKANFNISGGGNAVSYYMSGGFYNEKGMFNSNNAANANANYNQFNFRSNLKADLSPSTTLGIGFDGRYNTTTEPGQGVDKLLDIMNTINPTLFPAEYSNGTAPEEPIGISNPYSLLNKTGFVKRYANYMSTNLNVTQKLDFITKGLFLNGIASFTKSNFYSHNYIKNYQRHAPDFANSYMGSGRDEKGNLVTINKTPDLDDKMSFSYVAPTGNRVIELQGSMNYVQTFFKKLAVTGLLLYKQREFLTDAPDGSGATLLINALPAREQSVAGRLTFGWSDRYFTDINFGASGSQMFTPDKRWSTFPSIGFGWVPSSEKFWGDISNVVDFLKFRVSYGTVGAPGNATRFGYMATTGPVNGYTFGFGQAAGSGSYIPGVGESRLEQLNLTWERNQKLNLGAEIGFFREVKLVIDAYQYVNNDQLIDLNRLPATLGLPAIPKANLGKTKSRGIDFDLTYTKTWNNFRINYIKGIISYNTNTILENGQLDPKVAYQSGIGLDWGRSLNYIALGLFKDQKDIDNSPVQTWNKVMPGDIKYKDIDGDGVITPNDRIWTGNAYPKWSYSLAIDLRYKKWTFATRAIGKFNMYRSISGGRIPFNPYNAGGNDNGAVYTAAVNHHWTPASYSGNAATENAGATYPRLGFGTDNQNNAQQSTFWLREASYVRIADAELGYNWTPRTKKSPFRSIYYYGRCDNVVTFSKFKDWNPEQFSSFAYPLKRTISVGLEIGFDL